MDTTSPTTADILRGAADHLSRYGWHQGGLRPPTSTHPSPPPLCTGAAISVAACGDIFGWLADASTSPAPVAADYFAHHIFMTKDVSGRHLVCVMAEWNDDPHRTANEVITELRTAAKRWESEHATTTP